MANTKTAKKAASKRRKNPRNDNATNSVTPLHAAAHDQTRGETYHVAEGDGAGNNVAREQEYAGAHGTVVSR